MHQYHCRRQNSLQNIIIVINIITGIITIFIIIITECEKSHCQIMMVIIIIIPNMFIFALQWFLCSSAFKKPPSWSLSFSKSPPVSIVIKGINCQTPFAAELAGGLRPAITSLDKNLGYIRKAIIDPSTDHAIMMTMTMTLTMIKTGTMTMMMICFAWSAVFADLVPPSSIPQSPTISYNGITQCKCVMCNVNG